MGLHRENITWQSKDGTWSLGFWDFYYVNRDSDDFDPEWDVEYTDTFNWVSTGHPTYESAEDSWKDANPGGGEMLAYSADAPSENDRLDALAKDFLAQKSKTGRSTRPW